MHMYNWSTDERRLKKTKKEYAIWKIEQMVNFGLRGKRIKKADLKKYWKELSIDPYRRKYLSMLLDERRHS